MSRPATLAAWLAYLETLHPKAIALGLERVARGARADWARALACPVVTVDRHQRQGLDLRDARGDPALRRLSHRASTRRRTSCATTSACASPATRQDDAALVAAFDAVEDARGERRRSPTSSSARSPRCGCSRAPGSTSLVLEVGLGGRLDAVNVVDADVAVRDERRPRPHGLPRRRRARTSAARRRGIFRAGRPAVCARARSAARRCVDARARDRRAAAA